jgi:hypothetical protein
MTPTRRLVPIGVLAAAVAAALPTLADGGAVRAMGCLATPVHGTAVRAGPFTGYLAPEYDVVHGRFRLHPGGYRDRATGLSQKIPWYAARTAKIAERLVVTGTRLAPAPARRFRQTFTYAGEYAQGHVFPSNLSPPAEGCWRLDFRSGQARATFVVLVSRQRAAGA